MSCWQLFLQALTDSCDGSHIRGCKTDEAIERDDLYPMCSKSAVFVPPTQSHLQLCMMGNRTGHCGGPTRTANTSQTGLSIVRVSEKDEKEKTESRNSAGPSGHWDRCIMPSDRIVELSSIPVVCLQPSVKLTA